MMAPKAEIPLYHQVRENGRTHFARRRRTSASSRKRGGGTATRWCFVNNCPFILLAFVIGAFFGSEVPRPSHDDPGHGNRGDTLSPSRPQSARNQPGGSSMHGASHDKSATTSDSVHRPGKDGHGGEGSYDDSKMRSGGDKSEDGQVGRDVLAGSSEWLKKHSFRARQGSHVSVKGSLDTSEEVTATAWIFIDDATGDINTILGNKMSGCGSDALGFALYINEWKKSDGKLWLEWGDGATGCHKLHSKDRVPTGKWVHVGARIGDGSASIFLNGESVHSKDGSRTLGSREDFAIGAFANKEFSFSGRISAVTVFGSALEDEEILKMASESGVQLLQDVLASETFSSKHSSLLLALQLDEYPEAGEDGGNAADTTQHESQVKSVYHFPHMHELPPIDSNLSDGLSNREITDEMRSKSDTDGRERAKKVKAAMQHAWEGYENYAWGEDELAPKSKKGKDVWGTMGVTLVDSLDTLWLMGMDKEFDQAKKWVKDSLTFNHATEVSVFETTIRELGGLLSAFDLSGDDVFKEKAKELADLLLPAFETESGIPTPRVNLKTGSRSGSKSVLAEIGTLQVEFRYLSHITKDSKYADKANRVFEVMSKQKTKKGLFPIYVNNNTGKPIGNQITFGALGDSFYEYLLKAWLQGGKTDTIFREMYDDAMDGMTDLLLTKSEPGKLTYVSDWNGHSKEHKMDHLVCFLAGTLALGAQTTKDEKRKARDMQTAKALGYTCYQMYARQKTGLAPEMVRFEDGKDMVVPRQAAYNILRPETAEALFVLHQLTGDPIYRDWSFEIFEAFEKHCRLPVAYGSFPDVNSLEAQPDDRMESFFLAETLKYLYLIQDPDQTVDLSKYVFNTEAHPLKILTAT